MGVPLGPEPTANRVADCLSMVSILGAPHGGPIPPKTMLSGLAIRIGCGSRGASGVLSMVFGYCGLFPLGFVVGRNGNHA